MVYYRLRGVQYLQFYLLRVLLCPAVSFSRVYSVNGFSAQIYEFFLERDMRHKLFFAIFVL